MSVKALPSEEAQIMTVVNMLQVSKCSCIRCTNPLMMPLVHDGAGEAEAEEAPPDLEDPLPMQISTMRLQISALEAYGDAVLSCLMGVVSSTMFVS
jgi:hypothetical protein